MVKCYWECEVFDKSLFSLFTSVILHVGRDELLKLSANDFIISVELVFFQKFEYYPFI